MKNDCCRHRVPFYFALAEAMPWRKNICIPATELCHSAHENWKHKSTFFPFTPIRSLVHTLVHTSDEVNLISKCNFFFIICEILVHWPHSLSFRVDEFFIKNLDANVSLGCKTEHFIRWRQLLEMRKKNQHFLIVTGYLKSHYFQILSCHTHVWKVTYR